jgi:DNA-binding transcriptional ArsR family regulator
MAYGARAIAALADPTRSAVFDQLAAGPKSVGELAAVLPVTRPAVSQHLKVLKEARLVRDEAVGTRRVYHIDPAGLGELRRWLDERWSQALSQFQDKAEDSQ